MRFVVVALGASVLKFANPDSNARTEIILVVSFILAIAVFMGFVAGSDPTEDQPDES